LERPRHPPFRRHRWTLSSHRERRGARRAFPAFKDVGGVYVNFDNPDFVLVLTQINRRAAVSGRTPMLVGR